MKWATRYGFFVFALMVLPAALDAEEVRRYSIPLQGSPSMGPEDAQVTIVEFLDYQ